nr:hypothetical protein [Candidatus Viridilinea mediisalina]
MARKVLPNVINHAIVQRPGRRFPRRASSGDLQAHPLIGEALELLDRW